MSANGLARVLAFALVDEGFSKHLAHAPDDALASIDAHLTKNEREALEDFSLTDFREATAILRDSSVAA